MSRPPALCYNSSFVTLTTSLPPMAKAKSKIQVENPLILRFHRLLDAFSKSDDERDFYLDRKEGFLVYADLDKGEDELLSLEKELHKQAKRYAMLPKLSYFETKKFMEGFVNEKVYDIDTKEKLLNIIAGKDARENFLEYIYDHVAELERWQQYYHERSRIRIIEWLRSENFSFVFEEDIDLPLAVVEKLKQMVHETKVPKDVATARDQLRAKSETYYSDQALNPRPKRGRPPKQQQKVEVEPQLTQDIYVDVPSAVRTFIFAPDFTSITFSAKFDTEAQFLASLKGTTSKVDTKLEALSQRLESLRHLSDRLKGADQVVPKSEEGLIQAVSKDDEGKVFEFAKGLLPKKKGRLPKEGKEIGEYLGKKKEATSKIKRVSQIKQKKKK